jgi:peptidoglycan/xylan/chitin deacetylase (PgdA/CDA1 family)
LLGNIAGSMENKVISARGNPFLVISLDFELFWGVRDVASVSKYGKNILGVREAVPAILKLFRLYGVNATWAVVGLASYENKKEILSSIPAELPEYVNQRFDPYQHLSAVGDNEKNDPYHFGYSLVRSIQDTPGMEIASHTFSHFYCLEPRVNHAAWRADLQASLTTLGRLGVQPSSMVFPRNQYDHTHLRAASDFGFRIFRGNEQGFLYEPRSHDENTISRRVTRLFDAYFDLTGPHSSQALMDDSGLINIPSSRFLRPCGARLFEELRFRRILAQMHDAAVSGAGFHLWWHPHNFGVNLPQNLRFLSRVLEYYLYLQEKFGMQSLTMAEVGVQSQ